MNEAVAATLEVYRRIKVLEYLEKRSGLLVLGFLIKNLTAGLQRHCENLTPAERRMYFITPVVIFPLTTYDE